MERETKQRRCQQPSARSVEAGQAEVLKEFPRSLAKFLANESRRDGHRFGTVKPFASSNPRNNQRELERRSEYIGYLQNRLVQAQNEARGNAASRGGSEKRVDCNHATHCKRQRELRRRGAVRKLARDRGGDSAFPPGRCWRSLNLVWHCMMG